MRWKSARNGVFFVLTMERMMMSRSSPWKSSTVLTMNLSSLLSLNDWYFFDPFLMRRAWSA